MTKDWEQGEASSCSKMFSVAEDKENDTRTHTYVVTTAHDFVQELYIADTLARRGAVMASKPFAISKPSAVLFHYLVKLKLLQQIAK